MATKRTSQRAPESAQISKASTTEVEAATSAVVKECLAAVRDVTETGMRWFPHGITTLSIEVAIGGATAKVLLKGPDNEAGPPVLKLLEAKVAPKFSDLWNNHPYPSDPCSTTFDNQCAIRMTVALVNSGIDTSGFDAMYPKRRCWFSHSPKHILAAEEMARWLDADQLFGGTSKRKNVTAADYKEKTGVVAFLNMPKSGGGTIDHIDLWDGNTESLRAGSKSYFDAAEEVWFWEVA